MNTKELLQKRREVKRKKPEFIMQDAHKKKRLPWKWSKPKGSDSKMRVSRRGYKRMLRVGWGSPSEVKGLNRQGLVPVTVNNVKELQKINPKTDIIVISASVGTKKRCEIIEAALGKNMLIANYKDSRKFLETVKQDAEAKKKEKETLKQTREKKKEEAAKVAQKKAKEAKKEEAKSEEEKQADKKAEEKKEKDKMLITTQ
jgi:large subunit ribosomal protein L32e